jgi:hypothetical protein
MSMYCILYYSSYDVESREVFRLDVPTGKK